MSQRPDCTAAATGEFLHDLLLDPARHSPDHPAVVEPAATGAPTVTTYAELTATVDACAATLAALELAPGTRVLLEAEVSAESIAVLLACSRTGLTFVPVSPEMPPDRLRALIETARPALHVRAATAERADLPVTLGTAHFGGGALVVERAPTATARRRRVPCVTDPAYIVFTSGTTGRPKGVVMSHRAVSAFCRGMLAYRIAAPGDRVAGTSPLHFDFSLLTIGLALGSGAAVVPVPPRLVRWPRPFLRALRDTKATQVNGVPSIWRQVLRHEADRLAELDHLRGVLFCGEEFPLPELRRLQELRPGMRIVNCYGATESMAATFEDVPEPLPAELERLSIGTAHPGAELLLRDGNGGLVDEPGTAGEMLLRSPALFSGYWDDPEATRAALVPDPLCPESGQVVLRTGDLATRGEKGELYFLGRADSQVQINGNRVELGEVERRLTRHPAVTAAAALRLPRPDGGGCLAAFVVADPRGGARHLSPTGAGEAAPGEDIAAVLRDFCARALPAYMVPAELRVVDVLPVTGNGKVDRAALAASAAGPARPGPAPSRAPQ
ncbi:MULTISPECIES: AMP-binding protein [unclassified Streptomyces]|uniref:AMP-binding protein n=1 Tax=unclassified Streptomyces TaxID=2593676 RepID=UPI00332153F1